MIMQPTHIVGLGIMRLFIVLFALLASAVPIATFATTSNLGETSEILFCNGGTAPYTGCAAAQLRTQADTLSTPVAIYEYVRNNYDYSLYHGARSGAVNTFLAGRGNDVDLAATLIAMLRSQGIPAHYVVGTARALPSQIANWLQVEDPTLAKSIMVDQGIQKVTSTTSAGTATLDFEHVWVEALIPFSHYRGDAVASVNCAAVPTPTDCHWVQLDPSWKQYTWGNSGLDPFPALSFDYTNYYNAIVNANAGDLSRVNKNPLEIYESQVLAWLASNAPGKTLQDIADFKGLVVETDGLLPASLPYAVSSSQRTYNSVSDHDLAVPATEPKLWMKYVTAQASFGGVILGNATVSLVDATTQRFTSTFNQNGSVSTQTYRLGGNPIGGAITLNAGTLTINGQVITTGSAFSMVVTMDGTPDPTGGTNDLTITATYPAVVGGYYLISTGGESSNWSQVHRASQQLLSANQQYTIVFNPSDPGTQYGACDPNSKINCTPYVDTTGAGVYSAGLATLQNSPAAMDALTGGLLYVASTQYFAQLRDDFTEAGHINKMVTPIAGFLGVVSSTNQPAEYINNTAFSILPSGLLIDMKGITINGNWRINSPTTAATDAARQFTFLGHISSSLEHETWQQLTGYDAVSTVRGIQMALANGATLLDLVKNTTTDTVQSMYAPMGFVSTAPNGFTLNRRGIYGTMMDSWGYATTDGTQSFSVLEIKPVSLADSRREYLDFVNSGLDPSLNCFYTDQNSLQSLANTYGGSATFNAPQTLCISAFPAGTTVSAAIALNQSDYANYRSNYVGAGYFDYLDEDKGFTSGNFLYRTINNAGVAAQPTSLVQGWRDNLYLQDLTKGWREYQVPNYMTTGANYQFSVDIAKVYDTSNDLLSATFEIQNRTGLPAGGGAVLPPVVAPNTPMSAQHTSSGVAP